MPTTRARSVRRAAAKRTILSALDENQPSSSNTVVLSAEDADAAAAAATKSTSKMTSSKTYNSNNDNDNTLPHPDSENNNMHTDVLSQQQRPFQIPQDFDTTNLESINILLEDIEKEVKRLQENIAIKCCEAIKKQHHAYFLKTMKIEKSVKKMTIGEFNDRYMKKNNSSQGVTDIVALMKSVMIDSSENNESNTAGGVVGISALGKKRFRNDVQAMNNMETPARPFRGNNNMKTPATVLRTAKRGETLMSANGSPVEQCEDGALVATVTKKRRANGIPDSAMFDINIGGKVISLSDPSAMSHLSNEMKNNVSAQLSVLQDQISKLMSQMES